MLSDIACSTFQSMIYLWSLSNDKPRASLSSSVDPGIFVFCRRVSLLNWSHECFPLEGLEDQAGVWWNPPYPPTNKWSQYLFPLTLSGLWHQFYIRGSSSSGHQLCFGWHGFCKLCKYRRNLSSGTDTQLNIKSWAWSIPGFKMTKSTRLGRKQTVLLRLSHLVAVYYPSV